MQKQLFTKPTQEQIAISEDFLKANFLSEGDSWEEHQLEEDLNYFSEPEAVLFLYEVKKIVGMTYLFQRVIHLGGAHFYIGRLTKKAPILSIGGEKILACGFGSVCVQRDQRRKGVGKKLLAEGMEVFKEWECEIAYLCTDIKKNSHFYEQFGFVPTSKDAQFYNRDGKRAQAWGSMVAPVSSKAVFEKVVNSKKRLNLGHGNW